jgi:hypothetical protein
MDWHIAAFPLILPWREDFWTLPLYFPDLKLGVTQGWPGQLPYQGLPLPPEAQVQPPDLKNYNPGELSQWKAFNDYQHSQAESADLLHDLRHYGRAQEPPPESSSQVWSLAWQMERLQADQDVQLGLVDLGQQWLKDILAPETWEERPAFSRASVVPEMVEPDLARLRYALWRRVMAPLLEDPWAPLLLGRTSRALFLSLKGWPELTGLNRVQFTLPGVHNAAEYQAVCPNGVAPPWQAQVMELLGNLLDEADGVEDLQAAVKELGEFVADEVVTHWPYPVIGNFDLEVWIADQEQAPVLCWSGAGGDILPG